MTCKDFENGFCKNTKRPPIKLFCERLCKGQKEVWSLWLADIQSKVRPEQKIKDAISAAEQAKAIGGLPGWFQKAKSLHKHAKQILEYRRATGRVLVSAEWKAARLEACNGCEKFWIQPASKIKVCKICGCNVVGLIGDKYGKADFEALTCKPWEKVDAKHKQIAGG